MSTPATRRKKRKVAFELPEKHKSLKTEPGLTADPATAPSSPQVPTSDPPAAPTPSTDELRQSIPKALDELLALKSGEADLRQTILGWINSEEERAEMEEWILSVETGHEAYAEKFDETGAKLTFQDPLQYGKLRKVFALGNFDLFIAAVSPYSNNGFSVSALRELIAPFTDKETDQDEILHGQELLFPLADAHAQHKTLLNDLIAFDRKHSESALQRELDFASETQTKEQVEQEIKALKAKLAKMTGDQVV